ncbi:hypothetical protein CGZ95_02430 [Enemella evansiae]|nr:hypothetical protein CGZ95_02430 [Enemella evansiae]
MQVSAQAMVTLTETRSNDVQVGVPDAATNRESQMLRTLALTAATLTGVTAVVYLNFSARVMPALAKLPNPAGIARMQQFNRTAVQPPFMICFFGAAVLGGYLIVRVARGERGTADLLAAAGGAAYLAGFLLTIGYHVPLNNRVDALTPTDPAAVGVWRDHLTNWTRANTLRAVLSVLGTGALIGAALAPPR